MRPRRRSGRSWPFAVLFVAVVATSGCRMQVDLGIDVERDGSGEVVVTVELDAEAADRLPDLATQLRLDDLQAAGWDVEGPTPAGRSTVVRATKAFATPPQATRVLQDVSGGAGPFREFELSRRSSFLTTDYTLTGTVDLSGGVEGFVDEELRRRLEGGDLSLETAELEELIGAPLEETFHFEVRADLPGSVDVQGTGTDQDDTAVWTPVVGERTTLAASSETLHTQRLVWMGVSGAGLLALVVAVVLGRRRSRH